VLGEYLTAWRRSGAMLLTKSPTYATRLDWRGHSSARQPIVDGVEKCFEVREHLVSLPT
jgi:hypothetical protein